MRSIDVATGGYLCSPGSVATSGYLCFITVITRPQRPIYTPGGGGDVTDDWRPTRKRVVHEPEQFLDLIEQIIREDEEIVAIIVAGIETGVI